MVVENKRVWPIIGAQCDGRNNRCESRAKKVFEELGCFLVMSDLGLFPGNTKI